MTRLRRDRRAFVVGGLAASAGALLGGARTAHAADATAELRVSATSLKVGDALDLELEVVSAGGGPAPEPVLPAGLASGFEILSNVATGSGFQISFGRGPRTRTSHSSIAVTALAIAPGKYSLSFEVEAGGTKVRSNVVEVVVEGAAATEPPEATATTGRPTEARSDVFVWSATSKSRAYVGEQIEYRLDVYERSLLSSVTLRTPPSFADFYTHDLPEGEATVEEVDGVPYRVRPGMRRALFPQKAGTLVIGAPEITIGRRRRDRGPAVAVEVLPLPAKGQPPGFSPNNVGTFTITAKADRTEVEVGQPFTWTVEIDGEGNIGLVDPGPWPELPSARRYEPKIQSTTRDTPRIGGRRSYAFLVIPEAPGRLELPAVALSYFDPATERYATARAEPIAIEVRGSAAAVPNAAEAPTPAQTDAAADFAPIIDADALPRDPVPAPWLTPTRWGWAMAALPTAAAGAWLTTAAWRRFGPDEAARRSTAQQRRRRERLDAAREAVETGEGFHVALASLLHDLAVSRLGPAGMGLPRPQLLRMLEQGGTPPAELRRLEALLERCDAARFAAQQGTIDERRDMLDDALGLIERSTLGRAAPPRGGA